jgi:ABC-2 type transport system permease protein
MPPLVDGRLVEGRLIEARAAWACVLLGWRQAREQRLALLGPVVLYVVVLAIFWQLWKATPLHELGAAGPTADALLWYLAITEWIVFTAAGRYREIKAEISSGTIESALLRPLPHGIATLARWTGSSTYQLVVLGAAGMLAGWWLTGTLPPHAALLPFVVLSAVLALALVLLCHLQLGYAALWFGTAAPAFWIWQKLLFVFGGLLFPLGFYPPALRLVAGNSPFAAMLFAPASLVLEGNAVRPASLLAGQIAWLAVLGALAVVVSHRATARLVHAGS